MILTEISSKIRQYSLKLNFRSLSKEFFIVTLGQILSVVGSIVAVKILTNYLSLIDYGELALGLTISTFFSQIIYGPLSQSIYRFWSSASENDKSKEIFRGALFLQGASFSIVVMITLIIFIVISSIHMPAKWTGLLIAASIYVIFGGFSASVDIIQQAVRQRVIVAWHQILGQWLRPLVIIILFAFLPKSSNTAFWGLVFVTGVVFISQGYFFYKSNRAIAPWKIRGSSNEWIRVLLNYAWPFCVWGIFTWGQQSFDRWSLQIFGYVREVGLYSALTTIGYTPIIILSSIVMQFLTPYVYRIAGDGLDETRMKQATRINAVASMLFLIIVSAGAVVFVFIGDPIMTLFSSKVYASVSGYLPIIVLSGGLFSAGQILSISLLSKRETKSLLLPKATTAILGMIFYFVGARWLGLKGVVFGNVGFSAIYFIWIFVLVFIGSKKKAAFQQA
jgi:O-antigen/teichoic acid export membrane protein